MAETEPAAPARASTSPPARADVVVIGAGVVGASVAYHLARRGVETLLIERAAISAGTTWHAAANMETYRADPLLHDMIAYAVELFPTLSAESGIAFGWRQPGRVNYTATPGASRSCARCPRAPVHAASRSNS